MGGNDDFIARTDVKSAQNEFDRFGSVGAADAVLRSREAGECGFELLDETVAVVANELAGR